MPQIISEQGILLSDLATRVAAELKGDGQTKVTHLCSFDSPEAGALTFARPGTSAKYAPALIKAQLAALIVAPSDVESFAGLNLLVAENPLAALVQLMPCFYQADRLAVGISPLASVASSAKIGKDVSISPFCSIGEGAQIADGVQLYPHVVIYPRAKIGAGTILHSAVVIREDCSIGANCIIHNGSVIGADGFGYYPDPKFGLRKVPQIGVVVIDDHVEIGANTCIDRATLGETRIGRNSKLDNLVQVGHNTRIGSNTILCGVVGVGGSCNIGNQVVLGGGSGVGDHVSIADGCRLAGFSATPSDLVEKGDFAGYPCVPVFEWKKQMMALRKLPTLLRKAAHLMKEEK